MNDLPAERRSVLITMAHRHGMEPQAFETVLRATVMPKETTREQFAAFLMVARDYDLNPITREIFAFPRPGGGIQPIVSVDGWMKLVNSHPQMNGMTFDDILTDDGELTGIKCRIHRKDRTHPTEIIEYMAECRRNTDTWRQWPIRMLRHKAAIQAARYAFGFSGILDPDEFERWTDKQPAERPPRTGKKEMARQFKAFEPTGTPEVSEEPKPEAEPAAAADYYADGWEARGQGTARDAPLNLAGRIAIEAWLAGWDARDEDLMKDAS